MSQPDQFPTTQWSMIRAIQKAPKSVLDRDGIDRFCRDYWPPLASFLQLAGLPREDAEDLTQEIFAEIHLDNRLSNADPDKGRMRSFLITIAKRRAYDFLRKKNTRKRGGANVHVPLDGHEEFLSDLSGPEREFDRAWAHQLIELTTQALRKDYVGRGRARWFEALFSRITDPIENGTYHEIAVGLASTEAAVKIAIHRMKQKYQKILREEVAKTVATPEEVDGELVALFNTLGRSS